MSDLELSEVSGQEPEYGVLRPTIRGAEPDRIDAHQTREYNTRQWAEKEVENWRAQGERAYVVVREWALLRPDETQPARTPIQSVSCGWCDDVARGSAFHYQSRRWYASCGRVLHGLSFEPSNRWQEHQ